MIETLKWQLEAITHPAGSLTQYEINAIQSFLIDFCNGVGNED